MIYGLSQNKITNNASDHKSFKLSAKFSNSKSWKVEKCCSFWNFQKLYHNSALTSDLNVFE